MITREVLEKAFNDPVEFSPAPWRKDNLSRAPTVSEIEERLLAAFPESASPGTQLPTDHARGCQGREYACNCAYDDAIAAELLRLQEENASIRSETIKECANIAYVTCAETRHVTLGDRARAAILALTTDPDRPDTGKPSPSLRTGKIEATLAVRLTALRQAKGVMQETVASAIHVSRSQIANLERGRGEPSISSLMALASYFGVSTDYLLGIPGEGR